MRDAMSAPRCPICGRSADMEPNDVGGWVCRNPACSYQRALEKAQGLARAASQESEIP